MRRGIRLFLWYSISIVALVMFNYDVMTLFGVGCIVISHELGHYLFALWEGADPKFIVTDAGNPGVRVAKSSVCISMGGFLVNFLLIPFLSIIMEIRWWGLVIMVFCLSANDIAKTVKILKGENVSE